MRSIYWLAILQLTFLSATGGESPAPARNGSHDFDFLIGNWKAHVRRLPDRLVGSKLGSSITASRIIKSFSIAMRTSRSLRSIIPRNTSTSKARHLGYTIPTRINGVSISSTWTRVFSASRQSSVNSMATAVNSTIRNSTKGARFWCAMSG